MLPLTTDKWASRLYSSKQSSGVLPLVTLVGISSSSLRHTLPSLYGSNTALMLAWNKVRIAPGVSG